LQVLAARGVILSAIVLGKSKPRSFQGAYATMTQNFGPEARGGACSAQLVLSESPILYIRTSPTPTIMVILSHEAYVRFGSEVKEGGHPDCRAGFGAAFPTSVNPSRSTAFPPLASPRNSAKRMVLNSVMVGFLHRRYPTARNPMRFRKGRSGFRPPKTFRDLNLQAFEKGIRIRSHRR